MNPYKKFIFAPSFLICLTLTFYFYSQILLKPPAEFLITFSIYEVVFLSIPLLVASLMYSLFVTFTQDIKYAFVLTFNAVLIPFAFLEPKLALVLAIGLIISLTLTYFNLQTNLRSYINFQPKTLIVGPLKMLNVFLLLTLSAAFYLHSNSIIQKEGFKLPESLIDWAVDISIASSGMSFKGEKQYLAQALTPEQIELLKQNPQILQQYGLKPEDLDALGVQKPSTNQSTDQSQNQSLMQQIPLPSGSLKDVLKNQINNMLDKTLEPYLFIIPILLALMFYSLISLILWLLSFLLSPLINLAFYIFDKSGFVKYEKEMREVKKIVI